MGEHLSRARALSNQSQAKRLLRFLNKCADPQTTGDLARAVGLPSGQAARALIELNDKGLVDRSGPGDRGGRRKWTISAALRTDLAGEGKHTAEPGDARIEIAYADHRDNRMIIVGAAAWETMAEQELRFAELPEVAYSDFIADFYDGEGYITKDKYVSQQTVETVLGRPIAECIAGGRKREDEFTSRLRKASAPTGEP